jgi:hypothetical protein
MKLLPLLVLLAGSLHAATTVEVEARFADVPAGTEIPATAEKLDKLKGVEVFSGPKVTTTPGKSAVIEVTQDTMVPGSAAVPLGVTLSITPTLGEKTIHFTGKATDRATHGKRSTDDLNTVEFATREIFFEGNLTSGDTILLHSNAVTAKGEKNVTKGRELVIFLKLTKRVTADAPAKKPAPVPAKKPAAPAKKPAAKKK